MFCLVLPMQAIGTDAWIVDRLTTSIRNDICRSDQPRIISSLIFQHNDRYSSMRLYEGSTENAEGSNCVKMSELNDMDVVIYSLVDDDTLYLGAMQEDGSLSPLSAWTDEPAFGESIEFLVDEVDRFSLKKQTQDQLEIEDGNAKDTAIIRIHHVMSDEECSYGQRQCPRGVHNPHGEESELLYYVEQQLLDEFEINMELKPELETLW